jgi:hypothetical protein
VNERDFRAQEAHVGLERFEVAGFHARGVERLMVLLDLGSTSQPESNDIHKISVDAVESRERAYVVAIPSVDKGVGESSGRFNAFLVSPSVSICRRCGRAHGEKETKTQKPFHETSPSSARRRFDRRLTSRLSRRGTRPHSGQFISHGRSNH